MTFRTVVQDGLIVVNTHGTIADGTPVEILVPKSPRSGTGAKPRARGKKKAARGKNATRTPGYGMWADRTDLGAPEEAVDRLRGLTRRRRFA